MNIKVIFAILAIVVIGGAGVYFMAGNSTTPAMPENEGESMHSDDVMNKDEMTSFTGKLQDLLARTGSYRCSVSQEVNGAHTDGIVYVADGKLRGDFESSVQGITIESHMIVKDSNIYAWTPISPNGFKIPQAEATKPADETTPSSQNYADFQQEYTYECAAWTIDETLFTLPEIDFVSVPGA